MDQQTRRALTAALSSLSAEFAADLREQMLAPGPTQQAARQLHADEKVGEDFAVWTDLLSRRAAVLWVLKSVYARALEDRRLVDRPGLLDPESQGFFERLAPNLGETAFLRWVYRDLGAPDGGLPELFAPQPAEIGHPDNELSQRLIQLWRERDPETGELRYRFDDERWDGRLLGDLYQDLDPVVKDRFALLQTPDFVSHFMLDQTLSPAITEHGADAVRVLDPACGSGHFLLESFRRLVDATAEQHPDWSRSRVVGQVLPRVVGIDLNDYACGLARARLVMLALDLSGGDSLAEASSFHPQVFWADGLEQIERDGPRASQQDWVLGTDEDAQLRAAMTRPEVKERLRPLLERRFEVVIGNPPYIVERDKAKLKYHRGKGKRKRYISAHRQYSLASPFTERAFQLASPGGWVGLITSNNFMKREFGKPLITEVLAKRDLFGVVDTSGAYLPGHGTPTVILFARNRAPEGETVRAVMGKRGEPGTPKDPARGHVWSSIVRGHAEAEYEDEFVSVADLPTQVLTQHPWSLKGGGSVELKARLDQAGRKSLGSLIRDCGAVVLTRADEVYVTPQGALRRRLPSRHIEPYIAGDAVREWCVEPRSEAIFPYDEDLLASLSPSVETRLWPHRSRLRGRVAFGKTQLERGLEWFEYSMLFTTRFEGSYRIAFTNVATHNHFCLLRRPALCNAHAPVVQLHAGADEHEYLWLLGLLNSSTACFWMKQVFHCKGSTAANKNHPDPARTAYEFAATGLEAFPVPGQATTRARLAALAGRIDALAQERADWLGDRRLASAIVEVGTVETLRDRLLQRWTEADHLRERMVALQEEIDWTTYHAFGLCGPDLLADEESFDALTCPRGGRPFEELSGRRGVRGGGPARRHPANRMPFALGRPEGCHRRLQGPAAVGDPGLQAPVAGHRAEHHRPRTPSQVRRAAAPLLAARRDRTVGTGARRLLQARPPGRGAGPAGTRAAGRRGPGGAGRRRLRPAGEPAARRRDRAQSNRPRVHRGGHEEARRLGGDMAAAATRGPGRDRRRDPRPAGLQPGQPRQVPRLRPHRVLEAPRQARRPQGAVHRLHRDPPRRPRLHPLRLGRLDPRPACHCPDGGRRGA